MKSRKIPQSEHDSTRIIWHIDGRTNLVTVTFPTKPPVGLEMNAGDIESMLRNLGNARASMQPDVAGAYPVGQKVMAVINPLWSLESDLLSGDCLLHLRDPGYGWLHYLLTPKEARELAKTLEAQAEHPQFAKKQRRDVN